ncbi:MAG: DUF3793 family protein [Fretibacterium sp.]|nr:DUF3793 family protein [Fretibacterium sp.]
MKRTVIRDLMLSIRESGDEEYLRAILFCFGAPTIMGLKAGSLLNLRREGTDLCALWEERGKAWLRTRGVETFSFSDADLGRGARGGLLVLLYRRELLSRILNSDGAREILSPLGYSASWDVEACLERLRERFIDGFPHEIGLFLDYPPEDVRGFIRNKGAGSLAVGYWKVYGDVGRARRAFRRFRRAENEAARSLLSGFKFPARTFAS